jgi:hypothetical protein
MPGRLARNSRVGEPSPEGEIAHPMLPGSPAELPEGGILFTCRLRAGPPKHGNSLQGPQSTSIHQFPRFRHHLLRQRVLKEGGVTGTDLRNNSEREFNNRIT